MAKKKKDEAVKQDETSGGSIAANDAWTGMLAVSLLALVVATGFLAWDLMQYSPDDNLKVPKLTGAPPGGVKNDPPKKEVDPPKKEEKNEDKKEEKKDDKKEEKKDDKKDAQLRQPLNDGSVLGFACAVPAPAIFARSSIHYWTRRQPAPSNRA